MTTVGPAPVALTIAGSDPSGGAGIQADLKTFCALGVYGMSVITAMTAQNTVGIRDVFGIPASFLGAQIDAVLDDITPLAVKVGMLGSAANVRTVRERLSAYRVEVVVVDPVMSATSGTALLDPVALDDLRKLLLPLSFLLTPNLDEAEALLGIEVRNRSQMLEAAKKLHGLGVGNVLVKGGHLENDRAVDVFFDGTAPVLLEEERVPVLDVHGTGCVLSAAITAYLARGVDVGRAVSLAKAFTTRAIRNGLHLGHGIGPCDPLGLRETDMS